MSEGARPAERTDAELRSAQFRKEREMNWRELEFLLDRVEREGLGALRQEDLIRLPVLYRGAVSSLSVARAISLDRNLVEYLTNLACRAYIFVYSSKRRPSEAFREFVARGLPEVVRRYRGYLALSAACLLLGVLCGCILTLMDLERFYSFVPEALAAERTPEADTESLRKALYDKDETGVDSLHLFATFLFTHNAKIGILCFSLGVAAGVPVVLLLFHNGLILGAFSALYQTRGLGVEFWAWVLPHGITELLAVCLCGAAGLVSGASLIFPGRHERLQNLTIHGRRIILAVIGAVGLFLAAALIEGFFRQMVHDVTARFVVAGASLALWIWYFGLSGRGSGREAP